MIRKVLIFTDKRNTLNRGETCTYMSLLFKTQLGSPFTDVLQMCHLVKPEHGLILFLKSCSVSPKGW